MTANEEDLPRDAHRVISPYRATYLSHLQTIGYTLSDVEQRILTNVADGTPDQAVPAPDPHGIPGVTAADADELLAAIRSTPTDDDGLPADESAGIEDQGVSAG